jgi:hypothetical protein
MSDDTLPRLTANTAELAAFATNAANSLAAGDWRMYGHWLGYLADTVAQNMKDAVAVAPVPADVQNAYDAAVAEVGP